MGRRPQPLNHGFFLYMKTNVTMVRKMGNFEVNQRTKDGMFNATLLLKQWNANKKNPKRDLSKFWESKKVKEFLEELEKEDDFLNTPKVAYYKSRGKNGGTWMHPYLFIKFAMWINPKFELTVIKFVYDELIKNRHSAGDNYLVLSSSGNKLKGYNFAEVAKCIQWIVFNKTGKNLRQTATEEQLAEIADLERKFAFAIDMGFIKNYKILLEELRNVYRTKYNQTA